ALATMMIATQNARAPKMRDIRITTAPLNTVVTTTVLASILLANSDPRPSWAFTLKYPRGRKAHRPRIWAVTIAASRRGGFMEVRAAYLASVQRATTTAANAPMRASFMIR